MLLSFSVKSHKILACFCNYSMHNQKLGGIFWKGRKIIHLFSTDFLITWLQLTLLIRTMKKNSQGPWVSPFQILSVSTWPQGPNAVFSHDASLAIYYRGGRRRGKHPSRNAVQCLHPQRQLGSFGLGAHIVKAASVLKSLEGLLKNILNILVSSYPLLVLQRNCLNHMIDLILGSYSATTLQQRDVLSFNFMALYTGPFSHVCVISIKLQF